MAIIGAISQTVVKTIPVKNISLDTENPRYEEDKAEFGIKKWTDKELEKHILSGNSKEQGIQDILPSIKASGVKNPIWVHDMGQNKYKVLEGSRRLICLRQLIKEKVKPPKGVSYSSVTAHVYPKTTKQNVIDAQKLILQAGQKKWGAFNEARHIFKLINDDNYKIEDVAKMWKVNLSTINKEMLSYKYYTEFNKWKAKQQWGERDPDPRKYTYFQRASNDLRERFWGTKKLREQYYRLITPDARGNTRIKSVSTGKNQLFHFQKIVANEKILQKFLKSKTLTVDEALDEFKGTSPEDKFPWLKKLKDVAKGMNNLSEKDAKFIKKDKTWIKQIKTIYMAADDLIK